MNFLGRVETYVRVVEAGSLSKAARSLSLSLAAISRQISSLEEELGAPLLVRTTRSLRVTDEGRRFFEHATRLVQGAEAARASVRRDGVAHGNVVVSTSVTLGILRIVPSLPKLLAAHPGLDVELRLEDREADLAGEGVDVAVRAGMTLPDTTGLVAVPLATFARHVVASPSYLRRRGVPKTVASLASHAAVVGTGSSGVWRLGDETVRVAPRLRVGTLLAIREAAAEGIGIALLPDFVARPRLVDRSLRVLFPEAPLAPVMAHALYRVELRGVRRVEVVVAHLRGAMPLDA